MTDDERQEFDQIGERLSAFIRPVLQPIVDELAGIRKALELAVTVPPQPPAAPGCLHPMEQRIDFGVTDGVEDWQCKSCGYRTVAHR